jgi:uncharacterized DUF497 family protein
VDFEFDPRKSEINKTKHGIDFVEAQALWRSWHVLLGAKYALKKRYLGIDPKDYGKCAHAIKAAFRWSSRQSATSIGPRLSPIAERQSGLSV